MGYVIWIKLVVTASYVQEKLIKIASMQHTTRQLELGNVKVFVSTMRHLHHHAKHQLTAEMAKCAIWIKVTLVVSANYVQEKLLNIASMQDTSRHLELLFVKAFVSLEKSPLMIKRVDSKSTVLHWPLLQP